MKKFLASFLVVIMCLGIFAGCKPGAKADASLTDAVTYLESIYKDNAKETPIDYDVVGKVIIGTTEFSVTWEASDSRIAVKESDNGFEYRFFHSFILFTCLKVRDKCGFILHGIGFSFGNSRFNIESVTFLTDSQCF